MSVRRIAAMTGLSPGAVSLALRNSPKISEPTKRKVRKAAQKVGYRPNAKVTELMSQLRQTRSGQSSASFGVISFYDTPRPWDLSKHLLRIYNSMSERAETLGYRLDPLWLREPGMSYRRARSILDARGIEGLLCFGSPNFEEDFPRELEPFAIVTQGLSIRTPLHRIVSHVYNDMWKALDRLKELGYRRPGLAIGHYEDQRSAHAYLSAYLGWSKVTGNESPLPVLSMERVDGDLILPWLRKHKPDAIVFAHHYNTLPRFKALLAENGIRVPEQLGVAVISQILGETRFSGLEENQSLIGAWAVELLVSRIVNRDLGLPSQPRIEMVERRWVDGDSLRKA